MTATAPLLSTIGCNYTSGTDHPDVLPHDSSQAINLWATESAGEERGKLDPEPAHAIDGERASTWRTVEPLTQFKLTGLASRFPALSAAGKHFIRCC